MDAKIDLSTVLQSDPQFTSQLNSTFRARQESETTKFPPILNQTKNESHFQRKSVSIMQSNALNSRNSEINLGGGMIRSESI